MNIHISLHRHGLQKRLTGIPMTQHVTKMMIAFNDTDDVTNEWIISPQSFKLRTTWFEVKPVSLDVHINLRILIILDVQVNSTKKEWPKLISEVSLIKF